MHYDTLGEAASAADTGQTVTLLKDVSISSDVSFKKSVTLDLNDKTITGTNKSIKLEGGGKVTNGNLEKCYISIGHWNNKTTGSVENVKMDCETLTKDACAISVLGADVTVSNCEINNSAKSSSSGAIIAKFSMVAASINLTGTTIVQNTASNLTSANVINVGINVNRGCQISMANCDISLVSDKNAAFKLDQGTLTIGDDNKVKVTKEDGSDGIIFDKKQNKDGIVVVNGGTFDGDLLQLKDETEANVKVQINGGKFKISDTNSNDMNLMGVSYRDAEGGQYYDIIPSIYVAKVGETYYEDIDEALTAAKAASDKTIYVIKEATLSLEDIEGLNISSEGRRAVVTIEASLDDVLSKCKLTALRELKVVDNSETYTLQDVTTSEEGIKSGKVTKNILDEKKILDGKYIDSNSIYYIRNSEDYVTIGTQSDLTQVVALVGNKGFVTLGEAVDAVSYNDVNEVMKETITLVQDVSTNYAITTSYPKSAFTLDLNGFTLEFAGTNGGIVVTYLSSNMAQNAGGADITIRNGNILSNGIYPVIATNGLIEDVDIEVEDVTIDAPNGAGLYLPAKGNTSLKNVEINAKLVGVQTCAAKVTMENCSITTDGDNQAADKKGGDGLIPDGSAVSVVSRNDYMDVPQVTIVSGEYKSKDGVPAISGYTWNYTPNDSTNAIGEWNEEESPLEINGGIFSTNPEDFLGEGKETEQLHDDNYIVGANIVMEDGKISSGEFNEQDLEDYVAAESTEVSEDGTIIIRPNSEIVDPDNPDNPDPDNPDVIDPDGGDFDVDDPDADGSDDGDNNGSSGEDKQATEESSDTGDSSNIGLWIALMTLALAGGAGTVLFRRKSSAR